MDKSSKTYIPAPGFHLSRTEANKIGKAIDIFLKKAGREPTVEEFAKVTRASSNPAHAVVAKKYREMTRTAWANAADYCIRGVDVIWVSSGGETSAPSKAFYILQIPTSAPASSEARLILSQGQVAQSAEALASQESLMRQTIRTAFCDFAVVAGFVKARQSVLLLLSELKVQSRAEVHHGQKVRTSQVRRKIHTAH
jgi:hypothetical protein